nr:hypothetical protein [Tanacetum cinerariifolium]
MSLENMHHPDKLKTNDYFPLIPICFEPAQPRTDDIHEPLGNKPNDYHLFTPQSYYETKEVSSDKDVDEWLNEELSKRMTEEDKEEEEDALIDILKIVVEECKSVYKKAQIRTPSRGTSEFRGFTLPCTIGNLKIYVMVDVGAGIDMMPKSLFKHLNLANLKKTSMAIKIGVGNEKLKFDMQGEICHSRVPLENFYMEWVKEDFNFGVNIERTKDDPYSRNFDEYKDKFDKEIEQLWYDKGFEEEELWQNGIEEIDYTPPLAKNETFEVYRYIFKNGKSFICITKQMNDVLPLGRVNGSRFIEKTRKEMDEEGGDVKKT